VSYQWQVGGRTSPAPPGRRTQVKPGDTGKAISVVVTGTKAGYDAATSTASATGAGQAAPVTLSVDAPKKVKAGHKAKVRIKVGSAAGTPEGKIKITVDGKKVRGELVDGKLKLWLPKLWKPGTETVKVRFQPAAGWAPASDTFKIRVTKG
jgi:hypothetical protein